MKNLEEVKANVLLSAVIDKAIRKSLILRQRASRERLSHTSFCNRTATGLEEGANACCEVICKAFGGKLINIIETIKKIAAENNSPYLGNDNQDYIALYLAAFEERY